MNRYRVLAVASGGGHLQQLHYIVERVQREQPAEWVLLTPGSLARGDGPFVRVERCTDFSRETALRLGLSVREMWGVISRERPHAVVTTGAAPGLVAITCARLRRIPALWIDSVANAQRLSLSGRIAHRLGATVLSQWPEVARHHGVGYAGRVL